MDAILFVLCAGCQWNALTATGICTSSCAHRRFRDWTQAGVFEAFWRDGLLAYDDPVGIDWTWLSLDGAMGKAPLGGGKPAPTRPTAASAGSSAGSSARCSLTGAACRSALPSRAPTSTPPLLMRETLAAVPVARPEPTKRAPQHLCLDKGYDYAAPRALAQERGFHLHLRRRGEEIQAKRHRGAKARRWVVERAHAWLNLFRGILIRWPKKPENSRAFLHFACGIIVAQKTLPGSALRVR